MRKLSIKSARFLHEQSLDKWKRPTAIGGSAVYIVKRVLDIDGKIIRTLTSRAGGWGHG